MNAEGVGMCHQCYTSNIQVRNYDGNVLCQSCFGKQYPKSSFLNIPDPTIEDLKKKFERDYH